ncbi:MAG: ABC transporter substrate-binding protein [Pseudomonadota bacterium]
MIQILSPLKPGKLIVAMSILAIAGLGSTSGVLAADRPVTEIAATQGTPSDFIRGLGERAIAELTGNDIDDTTRRQRFVTLMDDHFKMDMVARFVLGRYWREFSDTELADFADLLQDYLALAYANQFRNFNGEQFVVGNATVNNNDTFVASQVLRADGPPINISWRLRDFDGEYRIIDITVEGLSMGITQRDEFASVIQNNGGRVSALTDALKQKIGK